jgi:hypothetical protein
MSVTGRSPAPRVREQAATLAREQGPDGWSGAGERASKLVSEINAQLC